MERRLLHEVGLNEVDFGHEWIEWRIIFKLLVWNGFRSD